jgi:uncharacterized protein (TIGR00369 family)
MSLARQPPCAAAHHWVPQSPGARISEPHGDAEHRPVFCPQARRSAPKRERRFSPHSTSALSRLGSYRQPRAPPAPAQPLAGSSEAAGLWAEAMSTPKQYALASLFGPGRQDMVSYVPHAQYLGIRVAETGPGFAVCSLPYRDELIGDPVRRVVFGGAITTLLDHASGIAVACALEELTAIATIDLRVDYLRAAEPGVELFARSDCYRHTRNVAFIRATAYERSSDDPFATAMGAFMIGANRSDSSFDKLVRARRGG